MLQRSRSQAAQGPERHEHAAGLGRFWSRQHPCFPLGSTGVALQIKYHDKGQVQLLGPQPSGIQMPLFQAPRKGWSPEQLSR